MSETSETATRILVKARELIAEPEHWVQGVEREGDSFCSIGAIKEALRGAKYEDNSRFWVTTVTDGWSTLVDAKNLLRDSIYVQSGHRGISLYNDDLNRTHAEILHVFDDAILRSKM